MWLNFLTLVWVCGFSFCAEGDGAGLVGMRNTVPFLDRVYSLKSRDDGKIAMNSSYACQTRKKWSKWTSDKAARVFKIVSTLFAFVQTFLLFIRLIACTEKRFFLITQNGQKRMRLFKMYNGADDEIRLIYLVSLDFQI